MVHLSEELERSAIAFAQKLNGVTGAQNVLLKGGHS